MIEEDGMNTEDIRCTAFEGNRKIASGPLLTVALAVKEVIGQGGLGAVLVFTSILPRLFPAFSITVSHSTCQKIF